MRLLAEQYQVSLPRSKLLTKEKQRNVKALLKDYYSSLVKHVTKVRFDVMILGFMQNRPCVSKLHSLQLCLLYSLIST